MVDKHQDTQNAGENQDPAPIVGAPDDGDALVAAAEAAIRELTDDLTAKYGAHGLAAKTALGDARDLVLELFHEQREAWHKIPETQQRYIAQRVEDRLRGIIHQLVNAIAAQDFPAIAVTLEQLAFKPKGIEAKLAMNAIDRATRHQLVDAQGKPVLIVIGDPAAFMGARAPARIDKQAPELPLDREEQPNGEAKGTIGVDDVARVQEEARQVGRGDGSDGKPYHAARWPAGEYGHADYHIGFAQGQADRARWAAVRPDAEPQPARPRRRGRPRSAASASSGGAAP